MLNLLGGLDQPDAGKVFMKGISIYDEGKNLSVFRRRNIGFIFQSYHLMPFLNVWENIILPAGIDGTSLDKAFAYELLERLELSDKKGSFPEELSGGQQQRVAIARALIMKPSIVLADEPTGALDSASGKAVLDLLTEFNRKGQTTIMVTHDLKSALRGNRILYLRDGRINGECALGAYRGEDEPVSEERKEKLFHFLEEMGW